jgi:hypothetical protein
VSTTIIRFDLNIVSSIYDRVGEKNSPTLFFIFIVFLIKILYFYYFDKIKEL